MKLSRVSMIILSLVMISLAGCSDVVYRDRMVRGFEFGGIRSGEWVQTKTVHGVLVRREHRSGFEIGALYIGHTTVNYSRTKQQQTEASNTGASQ